MIFVNFSPVGELVFYGVIVLQWLFGEKPNRQRCGVVADAGNFKQCGRR